LIPKNNTNSESKNSNLSGPNGNLGSSSSSSSNVSGSNGNLDSSSGTVSSNQSGGKQYHTYNKKRYVVRIGKKGGKYILANNKKIYV
jgi:hypothetical protein